MPSAVDFPAIYATDLVYVPDCWQLCGNAHCCNFTRLKQRFRLLDAKKAQELPLLPGEHDYLRSIGALDQFGDHEHRVEHYAFGGRQMTIETIVSRRTGCCCEHATRTTVCRLYPFLPVLDENGRMSEVVRLGIFDVMEDIEGGERICKVEAIPPQERSKLEHLVAAITVDPTARFYLGAYHIAQEHVRERLIALRGERTVGIFSVFEGAMLRRRLIDHEVLASRLTALADAIEARHGPLRLT
jgi:hypothetical protein